MTDTDDQNTNEENLKALREKASRVDALEGANQELQRELAIRDSKVDTKAPAFELFKKGYDGEWTPDALNAAAEKYGLLAEAPGGGGQQKQETPPAQQQQQGTEFSDAQIAFLQAQGVQLPGMQGPTSAADLFNQQAAAAAQRMTQSQAGGTVEQPGQTSNDDWKLAQSPDEFMAKYLAAGGTVTTD